MKLFIVYTSKTTELRLKDVTTVLGGGHRTSKCCTLNNFNKAKDGKSWHYSLSLLLITTTYQLPLVLNFGTTEQRESLPQKITHL